MIEILPLGGLGEVGRNMTAVRFDDQWVIIDMGIRLDAVQAFEDLDISGMSSEELVNINAIPDDRLVRKRNVRAIVLTHGHLDHIGAVGKLAHAYDAPIYGTPFTIELVKKLVWEERTVKPKQEFVKVSPGDRIEIGDLEISFYHATHSIPQTVFVMLRMGERAVLCASDFKLDGAPLLGPPADLDELHRVGREGVSIALVGSVRVDEPGPTGSEAKARSMLEETMEKANSGGKALLATTFSSHIARIKSMVDISFQLGRVPVLVGRSLRSYVSTALKLGLVSLPEEVSMYGSPESMRKFLKKANGSKGDYVVICTGHQGEPGSILSRIADRQLPFRISSGDRVIFSVSVIPNPINQSNRELLETKLLAQGARVYRDVHVSGHAARADTAEFLRLVSPEHLVPCHGTPEKLKAMAALGRELGYGRPNIHLLENGSSLRLFT